METIRDDASTPVKIFMRKPADMHQHLRDDAMLKLVAPMVAKRFSKAIVMPNLVPPITSYRAMHEYKQRIRRLGLDGFVPLMTMYLTDTLDLLDLRAGLVGNELVGVKYYPRGLTTNSDSGVQDPSALWTKDTRPYAVLRELADHNAVLLLHAADGFAAIEWTNEDRFYSPGDELDPYDQEAHFLSHTLLHIMEAHPNLKISVEHLSTAMGVTFMEAHGGDKLGCSLTAQHLLLDRRDVFRSGFRPHRFWWPIIQPREHREELRRFAAEGYPFVWLGSDSAPHPVGKKETNCCSGGVLMAHAGIELYVEAFEDIGCLDKLEDFASFNGPSFYNLKPSDQFLTLVRDEWRVEKPFFAREVGITETSVDEVVPFRLGETIRWKLVS